MKQYFVTLQRVETKTYVVDAMSSDSAAIKAERHMNVSPSPDVHLLSESFGVAEIIDVLKKGD